MADRTLVSRVQGGIVSALRSIGFSLGMPQDGVATNGTQKRVGAVPLRSETPQTYTLTGTTVRQRGFERHPVVQACVRAVIDIAATIPWQAVDGPPDDDKSKPIPKHPLQLLLDKPSEFISSKRFRRLSMTHFMIYGNSSTFLDRGGIRPEDQPKTLPKELRLIHPEDLLSVWVDTKGYPLYYLWRDSLGYTHTSPVTDIVHVRDIAAKGLVFGYPRAASALNDIIGDNEASEHVRQIVTNHGAPTAYALVSEETTQEEAEKAESKLYEKMVARGNRGRFLFLGVKDIKSVGFSLRDLEFPDLRRVAREDICAAFGVDPRMIGIASATSDSGLSGVQYVEARSRLVQHTVEPLLSDFVDELNHWLTPEYGNVWVRFNPEVLKSLVEDDAATSVRVDRELRNNTATIEEARVALGRPAEYDPTHTLLATPGTMLVPTAIALIQGETQSAASIAGSQAVVDNGGLPPAPPKQLGAGSSKNDDDDDDDEPEPKKGAVGDGKDGQRQIAVQQIPSGVLPTLDAVRTLSRGLVTTRSIKLTPEQRVLLWRMFDERAVREEAAYRRQALMLFAEERQNVTRVFEQQIAAAQRSQKRADDNSDDVPYIKSAQRRLKLLYKDEGEVEQRWTDRMQPLIGETFSRGAQHIVDSIGTERAKKKQTANTDIPAFTYDFQLGSIDAQRVITERAKRLAKLVGRTTAEAINDAIVIGIREGMSIAEIAKLVDKAAFGGSAGYRAVLIARTESIGALNQGQFYAADESGAIAGKEWLTQGDDRVRDTHAEQETMGVIEMAAPFSNGLQYPGDPAGDGEDIINCRCTLLYYDSLDG